MLERSQCILRPVGRDDLDKLLEWRNVERIRAFMYTDHIISPEEHAAWFERLGTNDTARTLIFEVDGRPLGVVNVTSIDRRNGTCHWGFYIGEADAPRGSGTALGYLGLDHIFGTLGIRKVIGEAFAFNEASIAFHRRLGFSQEGHFVQHVLKNGSYHDILSFALFREQWEAHKQNFTPFKPEAGNQ
ncbi:UDP-4-amino-4,6-dideoxy-N-acetyl-beta-L-altrosamine N-acetyltransferase [Geobacter hydrogenophilus]|uniref:Acetyltransferase n=1 Tax=Geobacter hydrogenophilus TaxID=40983 RepID=A0A9W6LD00_9BACT|nr:UDP-4-amino-4,6-dideoxy-N-acetyl-beta-L-altrosamine N-acetyltransferase [Geobacter hydrogenophilus]MBT0894224.1 UDP-4-amino-4,6-dideoxy-N-acetyl-beta-L-altrosamine N-acetyltransferase [Geobacter hydrogenophilus]GLI38490.1 acetyltransferase [Geobacter hydrogenophilus]